MLFGDKIEEMLELKNLREHKITTEISHKVSSGNKLDRENNVTRVNSM